MSKVPTVTIIAAATTVLALAIGGLAPQAQVPTPEPTPSQGSTKQVTPSASPTASKVAPSKESTRSKESAP